MHRLKCIEEHDLPAGVDWAVLQFEDGEVLVVIKRTMISSPRVLADAWAAYRQLRDRRRVPAA